MSGFKTVNVCIPEYNSRGLKAPSWDIDSLLEGSIQSVIDKLKGLELKLMEIGYYDISLQTSSGYEGLEIEVYGNRLETEKEYKDRLSIENRRAAARKKNAATNAVRAEKASVKKRADDLKKLAELKELYPDA